MNKIQRLPVFLASSVALFSLSISAVSAHVTVTPNEVGVAKFQTFDVSVPNEKEVDVTALRLVLPAGVKEVTPTVKDGWTIQTKKSGDEVAEISWTGGAIPTERRDDFSFSAQVPSETTTLQWKAYQTYADGTTVAWDQKPSGNEEESETSGPYSETKIVDDLANNESDSLPASVQMIKWVAYIALAIGVVALALTLRKRSS